MFWCFIVLFVFRVNSNCVPFFRLSPVTAYNQDKNFGNISCCEEQSIFDSDETVLSEIPVSQFVYYWGQLIFNDIAYEKTSALWDDYITTTVSCMNDTIINRHNNVTGLDCVTPALDASFVYGSDWQTTLALRTFSRGHLTLTEYGELPHVCDPSVVEKVTGPQATYSEIPCAGDPRNSETLQLLALQTLFVMEHNRICEDLIAHRSDQTDDQVFNKARFIITGLVQKITFEEWLPLVIGSTHPINPYVQPVVTSLNPISPRTSQEFALVFPAFFSSSENNRILYSDQNQELQSIPLDEGFFNPPLIHRELSGAEGVCTVLTGMLRDPLTSIGLHTPNGLLIRNYPAKTCKYSRDAISPLLADLFPQIGTLSNITTNPVRVELIRSIFPPGSTDEQIALYLDMYLGLSIEDHGPADDDILGPFGRNFIVTQLVNNTRDRDPNWYQAPHFGGLSKRQMRIIQKTSLADILNSNCVFINNLKSDDVFGMWAVSDVKVIEETNSNLNNANLASVITFTVLIGLMFIALVIVMVFVLVKYNTLSTPIKKS